MKSVVKGEDRERCLRNISSKHVTFSDIKKKNKKKEEEERGEVLNNIQKTLLEFQEHCLTVYLFFFSFKCAVIVIICEILSHVSHSLVFLSPCLF
jgi:hypothetical protein